MYAKNRDNRRSHSAGNLFPARRQKQRQRRELQIQVSFQQQTPEEERQFNDALQLYMTELIRRIMGAQGEKT